MENRITRPKAASIKGNISKKAWIKIMIFLFVVVVIFSLMVGSVFVSPKQIIKILIDWEHTKAMRIMLYVRVPRVMGAVFAGAGLSVSGAIIQSVLNNSMAGPNIIGVNAGAGFAIVLASALLPINPTLLPFAAFLGGISRYCN